MSDKKIIDQRSGRFLLLFGVSVGLLALAFSRWQSFFDTAYLYPVSWTAANLLDLLGIGTRLDASSLSVGFCLLIFDETTFRVIHECTGLFACLVLLAALAAYPAPVRHKLLGLLLGLPAFFAYSALRLVVLGIIAHFQPAWIRFFHLYLMVLLNFGFMVFAWASWVEGVSRRAR